MAKKSNKAYVQISSTKTIQVTCGLQFMDVTNPDAHVPDRLRVLEKWSNSIILVKKGAHDYPVEILEWPTVKALVEAKVFTVGEEKDTTTEDSAEKMKEVVKEMQEELSPLQDATADVKAE